MFELPDIKPEEVIIYLRKYALLYCNKLFSPCKEHFVLAFFDIFFDNSMFILYIDNLQHIFLVYKKSIDL